MTALINVNLLELVDLILQIDVGDLLTFIAIILAYLTYVKYAKDKHESIKLFLRSFKYELDSLGKNYFSGKYRVGEFKDKLSYSPSLSIIPFSFLSLKNIFDLDLGVLSAPTGDFFDKMFKFKRGVYLYNYLIEKHKLISVADHTLSQNLTRKLENKGIRDDSISPDEFKEIVLDSGTLNPEELNLAKSLFEIRRTIHEDLISNNTETDSMHSLYMYLSQEVTSKLKRFDEYLPWYVKNERIVIVSAFVLFAVLSLYSL